MELIIIVVALVFIIVAPWLPAIRVMVTKHQIRRWTKKLSDTLTEERAKVSKDKQAPEGRVDGR